MRRLATLALFALWSCACNGPSSKGVFTFSWGAACPADPDPNVQRPAQDYAPCSFLPVAGALEAHCGSLDCHGQVGRNLRVYGLTGLRIKDPNDPGSGITGVGTTTVKERDATFLSVISIQPEVLSQVFLDEGARPERWIVYSKGSGLEHHKGGSPMPKPTGLCNESPCAANICVRSWLMGLLEEGASGVDADTARAACQGASEYPAPEPP